MDPEKARIKATLQEVLNSMFCPAAGCWPAHGCHYEYYHDAGADAHVLEVWPLRVESEDVDQAAVYRHTRSGGLYEPAEFDFAKLVKRMPLAHLHFSQQRSLFEIGWQEHGQKLELRVHIEPLDPLDEDLLGK